MGDTYDALSTETGEGFQLVVQIEGFPYILTDGPTARAITAWAATEITQALGGLQVHWDWQQRFTPWDPAIDVGSLRFGVMDCTGNDEFGKAIFGRGAGNATFMEASIDCNDTTIQAKRVNDFAASGTIYIGPEAATYSSKSTAATPDTFTISARGIYSPFKAATETEQRFGRDHRLPLAADGVYSLPVISDEPREWRGKWVGIWAHRIVAGVLDVKAEAQLLWAGRIAEWSDSGNGMTIVTCDDARSAIKECALLHQQWSATLADQIHFTDGMEFDAHDKVTSTHYNANPLSVVASGASGVNEMDAGSYSLEEFASILNDWLAAEFAAGRLGHSWTYAFNADEGNAWFRFQDGVAGDNQATFITNTAAKPILTAMGFDGSEELDNGTASWGSATKTYPLKGQTARVFIPEVLDTDITVENVRGSFADNSTYLPGPPLSSGTYGLVQFDQKSFAVFQWVDATTIRFKRLAGAASSTSFAITGERFPTGGLSIPTVDPPVEVRQVYLLNGDFGEILTSIVASTGTAGYNNATYDVLPAQLGAAIPWEILGTSWTESMNALTSASDTISIYLDKPTRLQDAIGVEMVARMAAFVWKNQALRVVTWTTPVASQAVHTFTESNKAGQLGDDSITVSQVTDQYLVNHVKLAYSRRPDGTFRNIDSIEHPQSIDAVGPKAKTLEMRNSYSGLNWADGIAEIREGLLSTVPMFGQPLYTVRRTINFNYFENVTPADIVLVSDDHIRDPATGERGITNKPGMVIGVRVDWGGFEQDSRDTRPMVGEIDILLLPIDHVPVYSPSALLASYTAGTLTVTCEAHAFSHSAEDADASHFAAGDKVFIVERDPDDPAAAQSWSDTVVSVSGNDIVLTTGLAGYDANLLYAVLSDTYSTAVDAQKADAYQADNADGQVADTIDAYRWGANPNQAGTFTKVVHTDTTVELYSQDLYGDGKPLDVYQERMASRLVNHLVNVRTAIQGSSMGRTVKTAPAGSGGLPGPRGIVEIIPIHLGPGDLITGERLLYLTPFLRRATAGASENLYATLCARRPTGPDVSTADLDDPQYQLNGPMSNTVSWAVTTDTWALGATTGVSIRCANSYTGIAYLVIEVEENVQTYGMNWNLGRYDQ